jgi:hypothetical protein
MKEKYFPEDGQFRNQNAGVKTPAALRFYGTSKLVPCYESSLPRAIQLGPEIVCDAHDL